MDVEGGSVLEQLSQPCEEFGRNSAFLLRHVKGEYEDEDGDLAMGFIVADPMPSANPSFFSGPVLGKDSKRFVNAAFPEIICVNVDGEALEVAGPRTMESRIGGREQGSDFLSSLHGEDTTLHSRRDGPEASWQPVTLGRNCSDAETDVEFRSPSVQDGNNGLTEPLVGKEGHNRKRQIDRANASHVSDEPERGLFHCESCGNTLRLDVLYPMLNCDCLLCIPCCRLHVESSFSEATRRARRHRGQSGPGQQHRPTGDDERGISASDAEEQSCLGDTHIMKGNLATSSEGEMVAAREVDLEMYEEVSAKESESCLESISCPTASCRGSLQLSGAQILAPEAFRNWEEAATQDLMEQCTSYIKCPGCGIVIEKVASEPPPGIALSGVPEFDRTVPFIELDGEGKQLSRSALCHRAEHRFRCSMCTVDFCGQCKAVPYHLGKTCEDFEEEKNSIKCLYCEVPVRSRRQDEVCSTPSVRELRKQLEKEDADAGWCMEKKELIAVREFASSVCSSFECRMHLRLACTRILDCGHHCGGVRGERLCLPCLEDDCRQKVLYDHGHKHIPSADDLCSICLVEPLRRAPSIQLGCGHVVHVKCAQGKLKNGFPGPSISFGYLNCPQCPELMQHSSLSWYLQKELALLEQVKEKAVTRLKMEGLFGSAKELMEGGRFEGNPADFALQLYQYYVCCKCKAPYFGGLRDCGANEGEQNRNSHNPWDLVCGGCSVPTVGMGLCKMGHGREFVEFKCKFCCSRAAYFCFGRTHFCENCHTTRPDCGPTKLAICKGPKLCPLGLVHAPNGQECCLGCSLCRVHGQ